MSEEEVENALRDYLRRPPPIDVENKGIHNDEEENKAFGIPCPKANTIPPLVAKAVVLRCIVCRENQIQTVNFPCMHACFCIECAQSSLAHSKTCPQCRENYMHISMLYLSYGDATEEDIAYPDKKRRIN